MGENKMNANKFGKLSAAERQKLIEQLQAANNQVSKYSRDDWGNAERFVDMFGNKCKWVPERDQWVVWNGVLWMWDEDGAVVRMVGEMHKAMQEEIDEVSSNEPAVKTSSQYNWLRKSRSAGGVTNTLRLVKSMDGMTTSISAYDNKGHYFGVENGILDLRPHRFRLISGDSAYLMTNRTNIKYDPDAKCDNWLALLDRIFQGNQELISFVQRVFGQAMLGFEGKDKLVIFYGVGANGKTTIVKGLQAILGDYGATTDPAVITSNSTNSFGRREYYLATLKGKRAVAMNESGEGDVIAVAIVKMLVDSGNIQARYPAGRPFDYPPIFTPILSTNHKPSAPDDYALWRRLLLVPFTYTIPLEERDNRFFDRVLRPELSGMLNWAIQGAIEYQVSGLREPNIVRMATEEYRNEQDKLGQFLENECTRGGHVKMSVLMFRWKQWCEENGYHYWGTRKMREQLKQKGILSHTDARGDVWVENLQLRKQGQVERVRNGFVMSIPEELME